MLKYVRVRNASQFSNFTRVGQTISFDAVHALNNLQRQKVDGTLLIPIVYDNPVTLRVQILDTDQVLGVRVNDTATAFTIQTTAGGRYVLLDTPLNYSRHVELALDTSLTTATSTPTVEPTATPTSTPTVTPIVEPTSTPTATPTSTPVVCPCSLWSDAVVPASPPWEIPMPLSWACSSAPMSMATSPGCVSTKGAPIPARTLVTCGPGPAPY